MNGVVRGDKTRLSFNLLGKILDETALDIGAIKVSSVEERRIRWTTYKNLRQWFDNWARDLQELGFAHMNQEGNFTIRVRVRVRATSQLVMINLGGSLMLMKRASPWMGAKATEEAVQRSSSMTLDFPTWARPQANQA